MRTEKVLLVWYSRTGATRTIAEQIAREITCDVEELIDTRSRTGTIGSLRAAIDAALGRLTLLKTVTHDPAEYDLVIVGTPVWSRSVPPPTRTYLVAHRQRFPRVAFFCTFGQHGTKRAFEMMSAAAGRAPEDVLAVRREDAKRGGHVERIHEFITALARGRAAA